MYRYAIGKLPARLDNLMDTTVNARGENVGPFLAAVPKPPPCWEGYRYEIRPGDAFTITSSGDGTAAQYPER